MKVIIGVAVLVLAAAASAENRCPPEQAIDWNIELLLPHEQCNKFYKCTYGQPVEQACFGDLHFNVDTWQCDWKHLVDCGDRVVPGADKDDESPDSSGHNPDIDIETDGGNGNTDPDSDNNDNNTETDGDDNQTDGGNNTETDGDNNETDGGNNTETDGDNNETDGGNNTETDGDNNETDGGNNIETDGGNNSETDGDNNETDGGNNNETDGDNSTDVGAFRPNGCPVNPRVFWLLPNESDCNAFFYCVWGRRIPTRCPSTLHFNPFLQVCDWPANAGCTSSFNKHADHRRQMMSHF